MTQDPSPPPRRRRTAAIPSPAEDTAPRGALYSPPDEPEAAPWGLGPAPAAPVVPAPSQGPSRASARVARADAADINHAMRVGGLTKSAAEVRGDALDGTLFGALPTPGPGFDRVTERVFNQPDPDAEYEQLETALRLGTQAFDSITAALDGAEDNARRAHRLFVCARVDAERFTIDAEVIEAAMRTEAVAQLQREKDAGTRTKQITEGDIAAKVAAMFPDEHRDLAERKVKSRKMIEHLEAFAGLWRSRCYSLAKMLESKR